MQEYEIDLVTRNDPLKFFEYLQQVWRCGLSDTTSDVTYVSLELSRKYKIDLCDYAIKAIENGFKVFDTHYILEHVLPKMKIEISTLKKYLKTIFTAFENSGFSEKQYQPIAMIAKENPETGHKILDELVKEDDSYCIGYISSILENLPFSDLESRQKAIFELFSDNKRFLNQALVLALGRLDYSKERNEFLLEETLKTLERLIGQNSSDLNKYICISFCELYKCNKRLKMWIINFAKHRDPSLLYPISQFLLKNCQSLVDDDWLEELLKEFESIECNNRGIINNLDCVLFTLLNKDNKDDFVTSFLFEWVLKSDFNATDISIDKIYNSTIYIIINDSSKFETFITKCLNHDCLEVNRIVPDLLSCFVIHNNKNVSLDQDVLKKMKLADIVYIIRKILGYVYDVYPLCSLMFSILTTFIENAQIVSLCEDVFVNKIGFDYPSAASNYLNEKRSSEHNSLMVKKINQIKGKIEMQMEAISSLPRLNELTIPNQKIKRTFIEERIVMNNAVEKVQVNAIWTQIARRIPLKYGSSWFSFRDGGYCDPMKLSVFSESYEIAKGEIYCPVNSSYERLLYRISKRGDL